MKKNCYINKKSSGLMVGLVLLSSTLSFAAQEGEAAFDQARYAAIEKLYLAGNLNKASIDDIQVVQQHRNALVDEKAKVAALYAPGMLNVAGKGLAVVALAGGLASAMGAIGAWGLLGSAKNRGLGYFESLRYMYSNLLFNDSSWSAGVRVKGTMGIDFMSKLTGNEQNLIAVGFAAPPVALCSLVLAGISKYLLNKASSYTSEIVRLEAEIKRDNAIIMMLQALLEK